VNIFLKHCMSVSYSVVCSFLWNTKKERINKYFVSFHFVSQFRRKISCGRLFVEDLQNQQYLLCFVENVSENKQNVFCHFLLDLEDIYNTRN